MIAAAGVLGVTVLGLTSRFFKPSSVEMEDDDETVNSLNQKSILSEQTTRPSSIMLSRSPSPQQSPVMYSQRGVVPRNDGDSLFFQILESYSGARNSAISPGLTTSSGASTPCLEPGAASGQNPSSGSGRRKRRSKKKRTVGTSN